MAFLVPRPSQCPDCMGGHIGMDQCDKCEGTGVVFKVKNATYPDTRKGYEDAEKALNAVTNNDIVTVTVMLRPPEVEWLETEMAKAVRDLMYPGEDFSDLDCG